MPMEDEVARGERVEKLMQNEDLVAHFAQVEATAIKQWREGETLEKREKAHSLIVALDELKRSFTKTVTRGVMARAANGPRPVR